jgi:hypothetical protein
MHTNLIEREGKIRFCSYIMGRTCKSVSVTEFFFSCYRLWTEARLTSDVAPATAVFSLRDFRATPEALNLRKWLSFYAAY